MKKLLIIIISALYSVLCSGQSYNDDDLIPIDSCIVIGHLENGLTYYIRKNNWPENRACFYLAQKVGSIQEEDNQRGLAHFLEHMCFNGTRHFPGKAINQFCESLGVEYGDGLNAYTSIEETVYNIDNVPTDIGERQLDSCLLILYDWANGLSLDSVEIEKERGVIHEEWRMGRDATERIYERQLPRLYPGSRYGQRMPIGLMEIVDNFEHQQLRDYYEKWYNPENQCVVVVGDVNVAHIEEKIKELFGEIIPSKNSGKVERLDVNDHKGIIYSIDKDEELQDNWIQLIFKHKTYTPEERKIIHYLKDNYKTIAAIYMLNTRYEDEALNKGCPFLSVSADDDKYLYSSTKGAFCLNARCNDGMQTEALASMLAICRQAAKYGFTTEEFNRFKDEYISLLENSLMSAEKRTSKGLARECYCNYLYGTDLSPVEDFVAIMKQIVETVPLDSINFRMSKLLPNNDDNMAIVNWNVDKKGLVYPTKKALRKALRKGRKLPITPYVDSLHDARLISEEPIGGDIVSQTENDNIGYKRLLLSNGAKVLLRHTDIEKSQVLFKAYGNAGWTMYGCEDDPNRQLFNSVMFGNNGYTTSQVNKILSGKQVHLSHSIGQRTFSFTGSFNPKDTETFMQLLYANFTNQTADENEFRNLLEETTILLENSKAVAEEAFSDSVAVISVNHHPRFKLLEVEDLTKVSLDRELEIFKDQTSNPSNYTFIFVGNFSDSIIMPLIEKYIASLPIRKKISNGEYIKTWVQEDLYCHFKREMETAKSMVKMDWFCESFPYTMENKIKVDLATRILNMVYTQIVREENSATYDCSASNYFIRGHENEVQCGFEAFCSMNPEKTSSVLNLMQSEFEKLSSDIDDTMFGNAKEAMLKELEEFIHTKNGFWIDAIWQNERYNFNTYTDRENTIKRVTKEHVMNFMSEFLKTSHKCETLMEPELNAGQ